LNARALSFLHRRATGAKRFSNGDFEYEADALRWLAAELGIGEPPLPELDEL